VRTERKTSTIQEQRGKEPCMVAEEMEGQEGMKIFDVERGGSNSR
jgi:hypothetical protein